MENYILKTCGGDSFTEISKNAKKIAEDASLLVEFEFNGRKCLVSKNTNLSDLWRDYINSWLMGWEEIGPNCVENYPLELQAELNKRQREKEAKNDAERLEYERKEKLKKQALGYHKMLLTHIVPPRIALVYPFLAGR